MEVKKVKTQKTAVKPVKVVNDSDVTVIYKTVIDSSVDPYEVARQIVDRTITEYVDEETTVLAPYSFRDCSNLTKLHVPNCTELGRSALLNCSSLSDYDFSSLEIIGSYAFNGVNLITELDLSSVKEVASSAFADESNRGNLTFMQRVVFDNLTTLSQYSFGGATQGSLPNKLFYIDCGHQLSTIPSKAFYNSRALAIILRKSDGICTFEATDAFTGSNIANGTGYFYVPRALIEEYKVATNATVYANQFRAIEDYDNKGITIITQPTDVTVKHATSFSCSVEADGIALRYQWQTSRDGVTWTNHTNTSATTNTFTTTATIVAWNNYKLRCVITDGQKNTVTTNAVTVTVTQ